jgi:division protein CdvB (Snf7/Vps24/ESCRT-III family)
MNLVTSQFDKQDKSVRAITARNEVLNKEIDAQKKISTLESALKNVAESFGENDKRTKAWQIQLNNANADLNKMGKELDENNKALDATSDGFGEAIKQRGKEKGTKKGSSKYLNRYPSLTKIICGECGSTFKRRTHSQKKK